MAKEMIFSGGGYKDIIDRGIKLGTLRRPDEICKLKSGETFNAICEGEGTVKAVALKTEVRRIIETPMPLLLTDGFLSVATTVKRMREFYPGTVPGSEMALTTFVGRDVYKNFDEDTKNLLINTPQEEAIRMPELRKVFFPSLAWWIGFNGGGAEHWLNFLEIENLAEWDSEVGEIRNWWKREIETHFSFPENFMRMVENGERGPNGNVFREMILFET